MKIKKINGGIYFVLNSLDTPSFTFQIRARAYSKQKFKFDTKKASCFNGVYGKIKNFNARLQ